MLPDVSSMKVISSLFLMSGGRSIVGGSSGNGSGDGGASQIGANASAIRRDCNSPIRLSDSEFTPLGRLKAVLGHLPENSMIPGIENPQATNPM